MMAPRDSRESDILILTALDLRDHEKWTGGKIAKSLGTTRSAVMGFFYRVRKAEITDCACTKPENKDGGMGRLWWAK